MIRIQAQAGRAQAYVDLAQNISKEDILSQNAEIYLESPCINNGKSTITCHNYQIWQDVTRRLGSVVLNG